MTEGLELGTQAEHTQLLVPPVAILGTASVAAPSWSRLRKDRATLRFAYDRVLVACGECVVKPGDGRVPLR